MGKYAISDYYYKKKVLHCHMPKKEYKYVNIVEKQGVTVLIILFHFFCKTMKYFSGKMVINLNWYRNNKILHLQ